MKNLRPTFFVLITVLIIACFSLGAAAQSTDQNFPTAVTSNQIIGAIKARDIGDSRTTTYYFAFAGAQGDIFVNVVTKNFVGDIDVFTQDGLRPLSKIVVFDSGLNETGRLLYLRKDERMILRVQGRTPGDDAATFQIKFAGSFVALKPTKEEAAPKIDDGEQQNTVNSVGTRLPPKPNPVEPKSNAVKPTTPLEPPKEKPAVELERSEEEVAEKKTPKPEVVVESTIKPPLRITSPTNAENAKATAAKKPPTVKKPVKEKEPDPLASIKLMVLMKDGSVIERQMNEVLKFSVDKGILTVILKGGSISRYPIVDVARVTIE